VDFQKAFNAAARAPLLHATAPSAVPLRMAGSLGSARKRHQLTGFRQWHQDKRRCTLARLCWWLLPMPLRMLRARAGRSWMLEDDDDSRLRIDHEAGRVYHP